ncbi:unnamed protein product [Arctogadus glacialis]
MNLYATKKSAAEGMLDIALFLANITHMKTVIEQGAGFRSRATVCCDRSSSGEDLMDVIGQLCPITSVRSSPEEHCGLRYYIAVLTLISFSLVLQIVAGVLIIIIARRDVSQQTNQKSLDSLNNVTTIIIFFIFITNICITVFGRIEFYRLPSYRRLLIFLNNSITFIIFLTFIINILLAGFGTQRSCLIQWMFQRLFLK